MIGEFEIGHLDRCPAKAVSMSEAVAAPGATFTEDDMALEIARGVEPFLRSQIQDGNWCDQDYWTAAREIGRIAVAAFNHCPTKIAEKNINTEVQK